MPPSTLIRSDHFNRPFRQTHPVPVNDLLWRLLGVAGCAERDEQRREVLDGRVGVRHAGRLVAEVDERVDIARGQACPRPCVELGRPAANAADPAWASRSAAPGWWRRD